MEETAVVGLEGMAGSVGFRGWNRLYEDVEVEFWGRHPLLRGNILHGWT